MDNKIFQTYVFAIDIECENFPRSQISEDVKRTLNKISMMSETSC